MLHLAGGDAALEERPQWVRSCFRSLNARHDLDLKLLNVGGGMGIDYRDHTRSFDWPGFCAGLAALIAEEGVAGTRIRFEIGRFLSAAWGYYLMEVLDIKRNHGQCFAVARSGTHHFRTGGPGPRPSLRGAARRAPVTLVGQLCTPKNVLARQQPVAALAVGDLLVFPWPAPMPGTSRTSTC
ncbi:hypothetical protein ACFSVK_12710 [Azorhizophilus paspali]|uniref:hypothetical protein n=1 Tax=Azorhizophilus paspali TaxID=69963 RepID=UPI00362BE592